MDLLALQAGLGIGGIIVGLLVLVLAIVTMYQIVGIVDAYEKKALTVFGEFRRLLKPGINFIPPFVPRTYAFDMRTQTLDVSRREAITRNDSPITADAVVYIKVIGAKKTFLEVDDYERAVSNPAQTTLRTVLGDMGLDDMLNKHQEINARIRKKLDEPTDEWGVHMESVEVREASPSTDVQQAMEQQTSAERHHCAMIFETQGERHSTTEQAEGERQSNIIRAQGGKQSQILRTQGDAISTVLRTKPAELMGERAIIDKDMGMLERIGQGESTALVLPQELTSLIGRYDKQLTGSDVQDMKGLSSKQFDEETRELISFDDIEGILGQADQAAEIDVEQLERETEATKIGTEVNDIKSPDEVIAKADEDEQPTKSSDEVVTGSGDVGDAAVTDSSANANSADSGQSAVDEADDDGSEISFEKDLEQ